MPTHLQGEGLTLLFHGPSSEKRVYEASSDCRLLLEGPLTVEQSRAVVTITHEGGLRHGDEALVLGPVDEASSAAVDALLKVLEEGIRGVRVFLWAKDHGEVLPTLRSRCREVWCSGGPLLPPVKSWEDLWVDPLEEGPRAFFEAVTESLAGQDPSVWGPLSVEAWERVRQGLASKTCSTAQVDAVRTVLAKMEG